MPQIPDPRCRRTAVLACHPEFSCAAVRALEATVCLLDGQQLSVAFSLRGDLDRLRFPMPGAPRRVDRLWEHACFEVFLARPGQDAYLELNLAPSTEWAAYRFQRYREGGCPALDLEPRITVHRTPGRLDLRAAALLEPEDVCQGLQVGLSAVLEPLEGPLSYWALRHGPGRPDFHLRAAFALEVPSGALP